MKNTLLLISAIIFFNYAFGSAILGGNLSVKHSYSYGYITSIDLLNDCAGSNAPDSILVHYQCLSQGNLSFNKYAVMEINTGSVVVDLHDTSTITCNGGTALGYKRYKYWDYAPLDSTQDWKIYISVQGRGGTNSCVTNSLQNFYMECFLFLSYGANTNPTSSYHADTRIFTKYSFCLNNAYSDWEGDSLSYELIPPMLDSSNSVVYNYPHNELNFIPSLNPIIFDSITGDICFNASINFTGITKLQITEWRVVNGQRRIIGISQRDLLIHSYTVYNHTPELSGMDLSLSKKYDSKDTVFSKVFYFGDTIHFHINAYDSDSGKNSNCNNAHQIMIEKIYASSNIPPSASIQYIYNNTDSAYVDFLWIPSYNDISTIPYKLSMKVGDHWSALQESGIDTFQYHLQIIKNPTGLREQASEVKCSIFPNPANDFVVIQLNEVFPEISFSLLDVSGRVVKKGLFRNKKEIRIDLSETAKGIYLLKIKIENEIIVKKIIVD